MGSQKTLKITNARENNLKNISLEIPHDSLTVITGLSGSGKSSLAFDTVYAEGQRRYIETFSPYTRQFFDKVKKPDVDTIENVRPAIAIQQRTRVTGSRSTVGTMTNVNEYIKILWSNLASPVCPHCGITLRLWDPKSLTKHLKNFFALKKSATILICATVEMPDKKALVIEEIKELQEKGFSRFLHIKKRDIKSLDEFSHDALQNDHDLYVVIDRIRANSFQEKRVRESIEQAFSLSKGACCIVEWEEEGRHRPLIRVLNTPEQANIRPLPFKSSFFFNSFRCEGGPLKIANPRPALFSFNSPLGACPECKGFGNILTIDRKLCVPDESLSIKEKALQCWSGDAARGEYKRLLKFCDKQNISIDSPWKDLNDSQKELIFTYKARDFMGVLPWFRYIERKIYKLHVRVFISRYRTQLPCPTCNGSRFKSDALAYQINGKNIADIFEMSIKELLDWLLRLRDSLKEEEKLPRQLRDVFHSVVSQLEYLDSLGLPYLTLNRQARSLSGGETQRVNLATALGSDLISTHFVLDEPSVGLHPRDTSRLLESIRKLEQRGNSVLMVEHDPDCILSADHIIELGPEAGEKGGRVVFSGKLEEWDSSRLEFKDLKQIKAAFRNTKASTKVLKIKGAKSRNIKCLDLTIPLEAFVCLTGVSGSGKSTFVSEVLLKAYQAYKKGDLNDTCSFIGGFENLEQVLLVDQSALAKSPRANIATYCGIWDAIRTQFAQTDDAIARALSKSSFSFNVSAGRCPACNGAGFIREDMQFLSDVYIPCEVCLGKRFQPSVLEVKLKGKNVDEILRMSVEAASVFFHSDQNIARPLELLSSLGLNHLTLGHPLSELSGGEAQRLKLIPFIDKSAGGKSLLIFDEPSTGLHTRDIEHLLELFAELKAKGHSILCVEHNLSLISCADWIIDLGPEGGEGGGSLVKEGKPEDLIADTSGSYTAQYLQNYLRKQSGAQSSESAQNNTSSKVTPKLSATNANAAKQQDKDKHQELVIRGAREHNLKDIDVKIPLDKVVALIGVSGSGKSSIAKDIIYSEGQRRYLDCLSPYARQFIKELKKPDIDAIQNLKPTICVYQHTFQPAHLSTVGTMSEVYNFLRLLYSKTAEQYCPDHPKERISSLSAEAICESVLELSDEQTRILAPIVKLKKGSHRPIFERALRSEINEVRVDGLFVRPSDFHYDLEKNKIHSIDYVIARFNKSRIDKDMLLDAVQQALALGNGTLLVHTKNKEEVLSAERTCPRCKRGFFKPDPEDLSFHSKRGACNRCHGSGLDKKGAPCSVCKGARLNTLARHLRLGEKNIHEISLLTPPELRLFLQNLKFDSRTSAIAKSIMTELLAKLSTLSKMGLDYLDINRDCETLSGGELQRLRLATAMGSPLSGVLYIFDEPSAGLHPLDNAKVLEEIHELKDMGNSVIIIEHDIQSILSSEYIIEVGPGGGTEGGHLVFEGSINQFKSNENSLSSKAIRETSVLPQAKTQEELPTLLIENASHNNLKNIDVEVPLNSFVVIAGVSGAGKSSLVHGVISENLQSRKDKTALTSSLNGTKIKSGIAVDRVLLIDQKPIGLNSRSTPASYLSLWDHIRNVFASTLEAKTRGLTASYFSYNTGKGRCPACKGLGVQKLEMSFLPDASVVCDTCGGKRYSDDALFVKFKDLSVSDVLSLTLEEARQLFLHHRKIHRALHNACELGLGYLTLGQSSATLSGGESQRMKLVSELSGSQRGHTLYLLDEPTTGLHKSDISRLIKTLRSLVDQNNSVIIIEHEEDIIRSADHVVELGPGPGDEGGRVIFSGNPKLLQKAKTPWGSLLRQKR